MMTNERQRRADLSKRIFHEIAVGKLQLSVRAADGSFPVVFALEHELLSEVMQRVETSGGSATTFVEFDDGKIARLAVRSARDHTVPDGAEDLGREPIHEDIEMGMMVVVARQYENGVVATVRIELPRHEGSVEYVDRGELQPA